MVWVVGTPKAGRHDSVKARSYGKEVERSGAPSRRMVGGWLDDMAFQKKAILLCNEHVRKWNPDAHGYEAKDIYRGQDFVMSKCDACGFFTRCTLHLPKGSS